MFKSFLCFLEFYLHGNSRKQMSGRDTYLKGMSLSERKESSSQENNEGKCVILDVGGDRFVASRHHLERFPATR